MNDHSRITETTTTTETEPKTETGTSSTGTDEELAAIAKQLRDLSLYLAKLRLVFGHRIGIQAPAVRALDHAQVSLLTLRTFFDPRGFEVFANNPIFDIKEALDESN
ncbi:hypothetical protein KAI46_14565 [bacterium]|nr:hypothetical protein [bacterium]